MIAGSYDGIQGGIANAGQIHAHPALWFSGDDYISYPNPFVGVSQFSIVAKVFATGQRGRIISCRDVLAGVGFDLVARSTSPSTDKLVFASGAGPIVVSSTQSLSNNIIYMVGCSYDAGYVRLYIAGVPDGAGTPSPVGSLPSTMFVGRLLQVLNPALYYLVGSTWDLRIWNRILSDEEMAAPYAVSNPVFNVAGHGIDTAAWADTAGGKTPTIFGTPEICYVLDERKIKKDGSVINP